MCAKTLDEPPLRVIEQLDPIQCGTEAAKHFLFAEGYTNLNSGSYGSHPKEVHDVFLYYRNRTEARPDAFVRYEYRTHLLDESRKATAQYLKVPLETCVLITNATTAFDTILRSLVFEAGDVIVYFNTVYGSFGNTITYLSETTPVKAERIEYRLPISDDDLCKVFEDTIVRLKTEGKNPRIACYDTVNTLPAVRMPFERLTKICKSHNVLSCIDGAHGIGSFPLDLNHLDADFFTSNCHKWLHVPRPCAFLHVPLRNQHLLRSTLPTGFGFNPLSQSPTQPATDEGRAFVANFAYVGTLDDTPYLCIEAAIKWRQKLRWQEKEGEHAIMSYTQDLAHRGGKRVAEILGTEVVDNDEKTLSNCPMTTVRLPVTCADTQAGAVSAWIMRTMILENDTAVNVFAYFGKCYTRLTAQVYLTIEDFERAAALLKEVCERASKEM